MVLLWSWSVVLLQEGSACHEFFDDPTLIDTPHSTPPHTPAHSVLSEPFYNTGNRSNKYFKSLIMMSKDDNHKMSNKTDTSSDRHTDLPAMRTNSRYIRYGRDRTICWRQSKQPFFGIDRIPVTPVSPLEKDFPWDYKKIRQKDLFDTQRRINEAFPKDDCLRTKKISDLNIKHDIKLRNSVTTAHANKMPRGKTFHRYSKEITLVQRSCSNFSSSTAGKAGSYKLKPVRLFKLEKLGEDPAIFK